MTESSEIYLKNIFLLRKKNGFVKAIDIAKALGYSKPSVSKALHSLKDKEFIIINDNGNIELTARGNEVASNIVMKCQTIKTYLTSVLNLSDEEACRNACEMTHDITDSCYCKMKDNIEEEIKC